MKRWLLLMGAVVMCAGATRLFAQAEKTSRPREARSYEKLPSAVAAPDSTVYALFPDFFFYRPVVVEDTEITFECFDTNDKLVDADTLRGIDKIKYILLVRKYQDYLHTTVDAEGKPSPRPESYTVCRYTRQNDGAWVCTSRAGNESTYLKETRDEILRTDSSATFDPESGKNLLIIRKYYKTEPVDSTVR